MCICSFLFFHFSNDNNKSEFRICLCCMPILRVFIFGTHTSFDLQSKKEKSNDFLVKIPLTITANCSLGSRELIRKQTRLTLTKKTHSRENQTNERGTENYWQATNERWFDTERQQQQQTKH